MRFEGISLSPELFQRAMTHRSASRQNNEQLELLGDAVLSLVLIDYLLVWYPNAPEGQLCKAKTRYCNGEYLVQCAKKLDLGSRLVLSRSEEASGGAYKASILEDAMEALIGAVFQEGGLDAARKFIGRYVMGNKPFTL